MKNLKAVAAEFNLFQVADIPAKYVNDNYDHRVKCGDYNMPEFITGLKGYESGLFYECKQDADYKGVITYYIDHSYLLLKKEGSGIMLMVMKDRNNKYYLHPHYYHLRKYNGINYHIKGEALKAIKEPNYIGVFTEKKIIAWIEYCENYIQILENVYNEVNNKNDEIKAKIAAFIASVPGCKVSTYSNTTDVETKLFRVRFDHFKDQKYLSTKIDFKGDLSDITEVEAARLLTV